MKKNKQIEKYTNRLINLEYIKWYQVVSVSLENIMKPEKPPQSHQQQGRVMWAIARGK